VLGMHFKGVRVAGRGNRDHSEDDSELSTSHDSSAQRVRTPVAARRD
jgi:hypothetical protein